MTRQFSEKEIKKYIKKHLYNDIRWLLCAATEWYAYIQLVKKEKKKNDYM